MAMGRIEGRAIAVTTTLLAGLVACPSGAQTIVPAPDGTGTQVFSTGNDYTITGGTTASDQQNLFHSFTEFSLGTGASATFSTDPAILNILSRVTGGNPSLIDGLLQVSGSNANLWLINPQGILFGENAALNLQGSFTATTADQVNFATGAWGTVGSTDYGALVGPPHSLQFSLGQPGSVVNAGTLRVSPGESVVLVGGQVLNTGTIAAPGGAIVISAVEGGNLVRLAQAGQLLNLEVATLTEGADDPVPWVPTALPALLTGGAIAIANTVTVNPDGTVQLADGTPIQPESGTTTVAGTLDVSGTQGGQLLVLGTDIALAAATLTATGTQGGGTVRIGGDAQGQGPLPRAQTTSVDAASTLAADALSNGAGGRVIVWADDTTTFAGSITARGGSAGGDGGFVETSGRQTLNFAEGRVDASAATGAAGLWLLDPSDITIGSAEAATIQNSLIVGNSVTISTIDGAPTDIAGPPG
ncbi:MAG TPA: filamentous hemagglutinin N-terminal domain-containing protein, partial [Candidatus Obscuribacterales bacterium]